MSERLVRVAVAGLGHWGPNLARNLAGLPGCEVAWLCDAVPGALARTGAQHPTARRTGDLADVLADGTVDAVVLATPVPTHADLAVQVLDAGLHCFVEKPLATTVADAERVVAAAQRADRIVMVGHLLEYHPAVEALKAIADSGQLGDLHYVYSHRLNLGKLRADENALWSLGAHDVSVMLRLLSNEEPAAVEARGESYMRPPIEDVVFCYLRFASGRAAHMHLSWLDPHKARRFTVVGSKRMATFDDMDLERKITVYDKGFDESTVGYGEYITRSGDIFSPRIPNREPLRIECEHFVECVRTGATPRSDGASGLRVVRVLEAAQATLDASRREARAVV